MNKDGGFDASTVRPSRLSQDVVVMVTRIEITVPTVNPHNYYSLATVGVTMGYARVIVILTKIVINRVLL